MINYLRLAILLSFSFSFSTYCQYNFIKACLVTNDNDTICGLIRDGGGIRNSRKCVYKKNRNDKAIKYSPVEIKSYWFAGDKRYSAQNTFIKKEYKPSFFDVLLEGSINLYYCRKNQDMSYYLEKDQGQLIGLRNEKILKPTHIDDDRVWHEQLVNSNAYIDTLYALFKDCKNIQGQLRQVEYNDKSLINITKAYLNSACQGENCITYEKDFSSSKSRFGIYTGIQVSKIFFTDSDAESEPIASVPLGIFYNIPLSRISERFSFQTELIIRNLNYDQGFTNIPDDLEEIRISSWTLGIPLFLKYKLSRKKLIPTIGFGKQFGLVLNSSVVYTINDSSPEESPWPEDFGSMLHVIQKGGWFFEFGINYPIAPKMRVFTNIRCQRDYNLIIPENYKNASFKWAEKNDVGVKYLTNFIALQVGVIF